MKFVASSSSLLKQLAIVAGVVPSKSVLPIIQNIHFELRDNQLHMTGTDLENSIQTQMPVTDGSASELQNVTVPAKLFQDTLKALPEQPISFEVDPDNLTILLKSDNGEYRMQGAPGDHFPKPPMPENSQTVSIPLHIMSRAIQKTEFAISSDDLKPAMMGLFVHFKPEHATFVSTDAHRLVRYRRMDINIAQEVSFILPRKSLSMVLSATHSIMDDNIHIEYDTRNAFFQIGTIRIICRLVDARFPDYEMVIPKLSPKRVHINKRELLSTMKRLDIYSNKSTHLGRFLFKANLLQVQSEDTDHLNQAKENLSCLYEGQDIEIGFNVSLMQDVIKSIDTEEVVIEMDTPGRAAVVTPSEDDMNESTLMLLMPVMLGQPAYA
jgi:DNA polymerase III subunit beta